MKIISIDWAFKKPLAIFDGENCIEMNIEKNETANKIIKKYGNEIQILCENMPHELKRSLLEMDIPILLVHPNLVKSFKDTNNIENPDDDFVSAQCIYNLYSQSPEYFTLAQIDPTQEVLRNLIKSFKDIQSTRIKIDQRNNIKSKFIEMEQIETTQLEKEETKIKNQIDKYLINFPVYNNFLVKVRGVGPLISAQLLAHIDIKKAYKASALIKYCGLGVTNSCADKKIKGENIHYNPELKTICLGHLGESLIKVNHDKYRQIYDNAKNRYIEKHGEAALTPAKSGDRKKDAWNKGRVHLTARRIMVKQFLSDFWSQWRKAEGLEVSYPYAIEVLGHKTFITDDPVNYITVEINNIQPQHTTIQNLPKTTLKPLKKVIRQISFR